MPELDIREYVPRHNADFLNAIRNQATPRFQSRIPAATKADYKASFEALWNYKPARNEFLDALINQIGQILVRNNAWTNPLAKFKTGLMTMGDTIEEIVIGLAEGRTYEHDRDYMEKILLGQEVPEVQAVYHKINREMMYKITIKQFALRRAFQADFGVSDFIVQLINSVTTADNYDEYIMTAELLKLVDETSGFFNINVPDVSSTDSDGADARAMLRRIRESIRKLSFISRRYNAARMPVSAQPSELELILTPEADAALDVEALAQLFNLDKAEVEARKTIVEREFFPEGGQALLTTKDFFVITDTLLETATQPNAAGMYDNHFLHHHSIISASPFAPAILFSTRESTPEVEISTPVTGLSDIEVVDRNGEVKEELERGDTYLVRGHAITDPEGGVNDAIILSIDGAESNATRVYQTGHLTIPLDESADEITVSAVSENDPEFTEDITLPLTGEYITYNPLELNDGDDNGDNVGG